jgi:hypothetical protein
MVNKSSNCMDIRTSFTLCQFCQQERLYHQEKTDVSKFGITENVSKQSHCRPFRYGVCVFSQMVISFVAAVIATFACSPGIKLDLHQPQISKNLKRRSPVPQSHRSLSETSTKRNSLVAKPSRIKVRPTLCMLIIRKERWTSRHG